MRSYICAEWLSRIFWQNYDRHLPDKSFQC